MSPDTPRRFILLVLTVLALVAAASLSVLAQEDEPSPVATLAADACVEPEA